MEIEIDLVAQLLNMEDEVASPEQLDQLGDTLGYFNTQAREGNPVVADDVYDKVKSLAEKHLPDSPALQILWDEVEDTQEESDDPLDRFLMEYPMQSIQTIKDWSNPAVERFPSQPGTLLHVSTKIDGHGIRLVYNDGVFVKATSRARNTRGRDLTDKVRLIVPPRIEIEGLCEVRGELCLPIDKLDEARKLTGKELKNSFTAVSSLIAPSAEPCDLLRFEAYKIFHDVSPAGLTDQYLELDSLGFSIPDYSTFQLDEGGVEELQEVFQDFVDDIDTDYILDGVVMAVDEVEFSDSLYADNVLALKVGRYAQNFYQGIVSHIDWKPGRTKITPVAVLEDGVLTQNGTQVRNVPLYEPVNIIHLEAYPGKVLNFKYGGEAGVLPCFPNGELLTQSVLPEIEVA